MCPANSAVFSSLSIRSELLQALQAVGYEAMTPIQNAVAAPLLEGRDVIAQAQTGSGKTAAFAIGLLNKLDISMLNTQALVICPTRELSDQVATEIRRLASALANTRVLTLCGGKPLHDQLKSLQKQPHVVVGTPGRLLKHLDIGSLNLKNIQTLVLDEADRMLDMGFLDDIQHIISRTNSLRQTLLFSATYPDEIAGISRDIQRQPVKLQVKAETSNTQIKQIFVFSNAEQKASSLFRAIEKFQPQQALIFCNRKDSIQALCATLAKRGFRARALHGDLDQRERDEALLLFSHQSISFLVATDVAARGLDISALPAVINYDLSPDPDTHLHRIGRTGRAGLEGLAVTFVDPDELHHVKKLETMLGDIVRYTELSAAYEDVGKPLQPPMTTLHLSVGKKDKIRPGDIVGALTASAELTNEYIGKITVQAKHSFVSVHSRVADKAMSILAEGKIKRRKVRARAIR